MKRYHEKIFISNWDKKALINLVNELNKNSWQYSKHCLDRLNEQYISSVEIQKVLEYIRKTILKSANIFEFYKDNNIIEKVCFRLPYSEYNDIILVISNTKKIITIYSNDVNDNHVTLKKELYNQS